MQKGNDHTIGGERTLGPEAAPDRSPSTIGDDATLRAEHQRKRFRAGDAILGRYKITGELGQGGMGVVFRCFDEVAGIDVAVKALPPAVSYSSDDMAEIRDNFRLVESLHHPRIAAVKTLERDEESGEYFLIMEYVEGMNLPRYRREQPGGVVSLAAALRVAGQIAQALDEAHRRGIIHRDIKPGNVMVTPSGEVKVLDFGLAAEVRSSLSRRSVAVVGTSGTPQYMPPEQWQGRRQGKATDQYALAVTIYEMLCGEVPFRSVFDSGNMEQMQRVVCSQPPEPIPEWNRRTWQALERGLAKNPDDRFGSCGELVSALESGKVSEPSRRAGLPLRGSDRQGKGGWGWGLALVLLPCMAALLMLSVRPVAVAPLAETPARVEQERPPAPPTEPAERQKPTLAPKSPQMRLLASGDLRMDTPTLRAGDTKTVDLGGGVKLELVWCPPGTFTMRSSMAERQATVAAGGKMEYRKDETQHKVTLTKGFWLGKHEVTQRQWQAVMGSNPSKFKEAGLDAPVESVSWSDCQEFAEKLNAPAGHECRLPTEAEWEYACRAGTTTAFHYGDDLDSSQANFNGNYPFGNGRKGEYRKTTVKVGSFRPNAWGLHDMIGNVYEWCQDWYGDYSPGTVVGPSGARTGSYRVHRGGSWLIDARRCRSASRSRLTPWTSHDFLGFRVAFAAPVQ